MLKFNNNHIFTGYLKQLLSTFNLPTCKVYTKEFEDYFIQNGKEDPRVLESTSTLGPGCLAVQTNYIKDRTLQYFSWNFADTDHHNCLWKTKKDIYFDETVWIPGLTKHLKSPGSYYDTVTHEYLGEYLRFLRDFYGFNLMSLYNCFNNKIYNNILFRFQKEIKTNEGTGDYKIPEIYFNSSDPNYKIYAFPVKLFENYTIAIDSSSGIELFCGFYDTSLDITDNRAKALIKNTHVKLNRSSFKEPYLYDKLDVSNWTCDKALEPGLNALAEEERDFITRWDIAARERDLKLFIKVPTACKSSVTVLEGDFRNYNDFRYSFERVDGTRLQDVETDTEAYEGKWRYTHNHSVVNLNKQYLNSYNFKPISKLQLLALNTGESYPFATRLIEYLSGSAVTPLDEISDNIKRVQTVVAENHHYPSIEGLWEPKLQKVIYEQLMAAGPFKAVDKTSLNLVETTSGGKSYKTNIENFDNHIETNVVKKLAKKPNGTSSDSKVLIDLREGKQPRLGHTTKSTFYDVLGYVDKDAEKWYASWQIKGDTATVNNNIQNVDIYDHLFDIE